MENKFKKGLLLGGVLTAVTLVGLAMTKPGQELTEELQQDLKVLTKKIKKQLLKAEDVTKEKFNELVDTVVKEYEEKKEMAVGAKKALVAALQDTWKELEEEYKKNADED